MQIQKTDNSLFKHFHRYLGIFKVIDAYSAKITLVLLVSRGKTYPLPFLKIEKSILILEKKALNYVYLWVEVSIQNVV